MPLAHGGNLRQVAKKYGYPIEQWLDLSTGINPSGFKPAPLSDACWQRLPENDDGLIEAALNYYGQSNFVLTPGSQWMIQNLPAIKETLVGPEQIDIGPVLLPKQGYQEHRLAWQESGFDIEYYEAQPTISQLNHCSVCVVIQPNNPTGQCYDQSQLNDWLAILKDNEAWLVVDEAFVDCTPDKSMLDRSGEEGLIVLRSIGKFFGLAGIRIGCIFAWTALLEKVNAAMGPWAISHPSREVAIQAFHNINWQRYAIEKCHDQSKKLRDVLIKYFQIKPTGTALFQTVYLDRSEEIFEHLCQHKILVRLLDCQTGLRFGLPPDRPECWQKLEQALALAPSVTLKKTNRLV